MEPAEPGLPLAALGQGQGRQLLPFNCCGLLWRDSTSAQDDLLADDCAVASCITAGSSARELNVGAGSHESRDAMKLGVAARDGLGLETGLRDLEIMLLGISSCGIDPAGTEEQGICCTSVLSETTGVTRLASRQSPPARRGGDGERITQGAPAVDGDGVSAPAKAAAAGDCGLSLHIALLVENWQSLGDHPPPQAESWAPPLERHKRGHGRGRWRTYAMGRCVRHSYSASVVAR